MRRLRHEQQAPHLMLLAMGAVLLISSGCRSSVNKEDDVVLTVPGNQTAQQPKANPLPPNIYKKIGQPVTRTVQGEAKPVKTLLGDLNGDGKITKADLQLATDLAVSKNNPTPRQMAAGDLNQDTLITIPEATAIDRALKEGIPTRSGKTGKS